MTKLLGVDRSYDTATITRKNIEETGEYIKANIDQLTDKWGLDLRSHTKKGTDDNDINKGTLGFLNQILGKWGFQEIKRSENRKRKLDKKTNKRVDVGGYELRPKKEYVDFDEHCLCKTTLGVNEPLLEVDVFGF